MLSILICFLGHICFSSHVCTDIIPIGYKKWHDKYSFWFDCDWYGRTPEHCEVLAGNSLNMGFTATEACCACGGGEITIPTPRPTSGPCTEGKWNPNGIEPCQSCSKCVNKEDIFQTCTKTRDTVCIINGCVDILVNPEKDLWFDGSSDHFGCEWYAHQPLHCDLYGHFYKNYGLVANQACCACGGGLTQQPTFSPTQSPLAGCMEGTFSKTGYAPCEQCSVCPDNINIFMKCSPTRDTICKDSICNDYIPENQIKWYDSSPDHFDCDWYGDRPQHCAYFSKGFGNFGQTALESCCSCGGGMKNTDILPTAQPTYLRNEYPECASIEIITHNFQNFIDGIYKVSSWTSITEKPVWSFQRDDSTKNILTAIYGVPNGWKLILADTIYGFLRTEFENTEIENQHLEYPLPLPFHTLSSEVHWISQGGIIQKGEIVATSLRCIPDV